MYLHLYVCVCGYIGFVCEMMVLMHRVFLILLLEKHLSLLIF